MRRLVIRNLLIMLTFGAVAAWAAGCGPMDQSAVGSAKQNVKLADNVAGADAPAQPAAEAPAAEKPAPEAKEAAKPAETKDKPAQAVPAKKAPRAVPAKKKAEKAPAAPKEPLPLLGNTSFEVKKEGVPVRWSFSDPAMLIAVGEASDGKHALGLKGVPGKWAIASQLINIQPSDLGKTLVVSAKAKAPHPGNLFLNVIYTVNGEQKFAQAAWAACTEWTELTLEAPLPADADPKSIRLRLMVRPDARVPFMVDDIKIAFK
ncbi:MAG: hypothetical protein QG656_1700 [Candidatus Hydrogenedentes bacterium]|nr:hypothetical protein [Candidatus Hydrogenedentota bacterium]